MASAVTDLETGLQAMLNLKPPGVSGSRITSLTSLCVSNIQSESVLIQKIYTHFKKTPGTHKLGVLYVVDSVTRKWLEQAKAQGQPINSSAQDGTYAAGVHRVTELMPVLMNDISQSAPDDQKEKIKKLLDIWEKGQTFPAPMLESFRQGLTGPAQSSMSSPKILAPSLSPKKQSQLQRPNVLNLTTTRLAETSTTPPGSPPANPLASLQSQGQAAPAQAAGTSGSSILEALANMARQNSNTPTSSGPSNGGLPAPSASYSMPTSALPQPVASSVQQPQSSYSPASQPVNNTSLPFSLQQMLGQSVQGGASAPPGNTGGVPNQFPGAPPAPAGGALDSNTQQQIMLIKLLAEQGVPFDKIPALIQSMTAAGAGGPAAPAPATQGSYPGQQPWNAPAPMRGDGHDRGYQDGGRSPQRFRGGRSRSRSPDRWGGQRGGHDYGRNSPRGRHDDRDRHGRRGNEYRQRSPPGRRGRSPSPDELPHVERWVEIDNSLPSGSIRVLSRTLFVGGVTCPEAELRKIFSRFGTVQTCIVNKDKRHAFVKMLTRKDAENAKINMEDTRNLEIPLRTRWGVGFGPRDCSDYATGISIIPIHKLTEADRKWMLTAEFGGSGGRPIESGLSVEEPDIEIGAGVSSKAISRRMQTDKGGSNGPKSTRHRDEDRYHDEDDRRRDGPPAHQSQGQVPGMPGFPFGIGTLPNGMPNFPPGFSFPDPGRGQ